MKGKTNQKINFQWLELNQSTYTFEFSNIMDSFILLLFFWCGQIESRKYLVG